MAVSVEGPSHIRGSVEKGQAHISGQCRRWSMEKCLLIMVINVEGPIRLTAGVPWKSFSLYWQSLEKGLPTLVASVEGPPYIAGRGRWALLYWWSMESVEVTPYIDGQCTRVPYKSGMWKQASIY